MVHRKCRSQGGESAGQHGGCNSPGDTKYILDTHHDPLMPSLTDSTCSNIHICTTPGHKNASRVSSTAASLSMSMEQVTELGELDGAALVANASIHRLVIDSYFQIFMTRSDNFQ